MRDRVIGASLTDITVGAARVSFNALEPFADVLDVFLREGRQERLQAQACATQGQGVYCGSYSYLGSNLNSLQYLDPIIAATWSDDGAIHDVCRALAPRFREPNATVRTYFANPFASHCLRRVGTHQVVFKALLVLHTMIRNGATDKVLAYLSSSEILRLRNVGSGQWDGTPDMSFPSRSIKRSTRAIRLQSAGESTGVCSISRRAYSCLQRHQTRRHTCAVRIKSRRAPFTFTRGGRTPWVFAREERCCTSAGTAGAGEE